MSVMVYVMRLLDDLSRRGAAGSLGVQHVLQDHHGGSLVDHRSALGPRAAPVAQHSLRGHGGQPLVDSRTGTGATRPGQLARPTRAPSRPPGPPRRTATGAARRPPRAPAPGRRPAPRRGSRRSGPGRPGRGARSRPGSPGTRTGRCGPPRSGRRRGRCRAVRRASSASRDLGRPLRGTRASASSIREASVPPPWATSSLPPPLPPTSGPTARTSSLALTPRARASSLTAATTDTLPSPSPMTTTTPGWPCGQPAADVERERAHVAAARAVGAVVATTLTPRRPARRRPPARRPAASSWPTPDLLDLLLGRAQPLDDVVDPLGQLLGPGLERLGELGDEHVLAGQEPVGVGADQRLDPAYAGADRRTRRAA